MLYFQQLVRIVACLGSPITERRSEAMSDNLIAHSHAFQRLEHGHVGKRLALPGAGEDEFGVGRHCLDDVDCRLAERASIIRAAGTIHMRESRSISDRFAFNISEDRPAVRMVNSSARAAVPVTVRSFRMNSGTSA